MYADDIALIRHKMSCCSLDLSHAVTLSAAGNSPTFRGFFIQGRLAADDSPVGTFVEPPSGGGVRLSSCNISNVCKRKLYTSDHICVGHDYWPGREYMHLCRQLGHTCICAQSFTLTLMCNAVSSKPNSKPLAQP